MKGHACKRIPRAANIIDKIFFFFLQDHINFIFFLYTVKIFKIIVISLEWFLLMNIFKVIFKEYFVNKLVNGNGFAICFVCIYVMAHS